MTTALERMSLGRYAYNYNKLKFSQGYHERTAKLDTFKLDQVHFLGLLFTSMLSSLGSFVS